MSLAASIIVPAAVAVLSLTVSFDLAAVDFLRTLRKRKVLVLGVIAQLTVLPVLALVVGALSGDPAVAVALVLVSVVPSGPTSNYLSEVGGGDVPLAMLLTIFGTLICVATLPVLLPVLLQSSQLQTEALIPTTFALLKGLLLMVLLPMALGMFAARSFPAFVRRIRLAATRVATAIFALLVVGAIASEWRLLAETFVRSAHWVLLLNLAALGIGLLSAKAARLPPSQCTVISLKVAVQNVSIAIAIALSLLGRTDVAAIAALYGICQLLTGVGFALLRRRAVAGIDSLSSPA